MRNYLEINSGSCEGQENQLASFFEKKYNGLAVVGLFQNPQCVIDGDEIDPNLIWEEFCSS